jgi:hypothetical protein
MPKLEKATYICLIAVSCASLGLLVEKHVKMAKLSLTRSLSSNGKLPLSRASLVGKQLPIAGVAWEDSSLNVVIALKSTCQYCVASLPLFRKISAIGRRRHPALPLVVVSPEEPDVTRDFLAKARITTNQVVQADLGRLGIVGTPSVLLLDAHGIIKVQLIGQLSEPQERRLVELLSE